MATKHTFRYLRNTRDGVVIKKETRRLTRQEAIRFNCLDCSGGYSAEVRKCEMRLCPLYPFRPYQQPTASA